MKNKDGNMTFDAINLALPEIHTHMEGVEDAAGKLSALADDLLEDAPVKKGSISFDNLAFPEIRIKRNK